ncbi:MAG: hypothetical protein AAB417_02675 [Patescibacteria group bacterium]
MITYHYSLWEDIKMAIQTFGRFFWLKKHRLIFFMPTLKRFREIRSFQKNIFIDISDDIQCYWVSSGTWGSYKAPNKIYICPWEIEQAGGINSVINHEIKHLQLFDKTKHMSYEEREKIIDES